MWRGQGGLRHPARVQQEACDVEELSPESAKYTIQTGQELPPALWVSPVPRAERKGPVPAFQTSSWKDTRSRNHKLGMPPLSLFLSLPHSSGPRTCRALHSIFSSLALSPVAFNLQDQGRGDPLPLTTHCPQGINCLGDQGPHGNCHLAVRPSLLALSLPPSNPVSPCIKKAPLRSLPCTIQCPALPLSPSSASHPTDLSPFLLHSSHWAVSAPPAWPLACVPVARPARGSGPPGAPAAGLAPPGCLDRSRPPRPRAQI